MTSVNEIPIKILNATKIDLGDRKLFSLEDLKQFIKSRKYRSTGCKKDIIERVLWICHPNNYTKPDNIECKQRGRPSNSKSTNSTNSTNSNKSIKKKIKKKIKKTITIHNYTNAKSKEELSQLKSSELTQIIQSHKYRYVGSKKVLIDRVWWILHKDTEKPPDIELKQRGRPSFKNNYVVQFINDDSEESVDSSEDDGDYNEYIWSVLFIENGKINKDNEGKKYFKFKDTNYLFKKTIVSDYLIYGKLNENDEVSLIKIKQISEYSEDLQNVIKEVCKCL